MKSHKKFVFIATVVVGLAHSPAPVRGQTSATPGSAVTLDSRGSVGPAVPSILALARAIDRYVDEERQMLDHDEVGEDLLLRHFRGLATIHARLARMDRKGQLVRLNPRERTTLSHALAELLAEPLHVGAVMGEGAGPRIRDADQNRIEQLVNIAEIANRRFNLGVREILGARIGGETS
jgi:hypothetical protein